MEAEIYLCRTESSVYEVRDQEALNVVNIRYVNT